MRNKNFAAPGGCGTALVTPFDRQQAVDWRAFEKLVNRQVESGIDFLVPCGTTGETATLSLDEYREVIQTCVRIADGRVPVVVGAGSNATAHAVELGHTAIAAGADALLSVGPYYNKPSQEGLLQHFSRIAESSSVPVIVYNVPGRTGNNIQADTLLRLAEVDGIVAVKEASGDLSQIMQILRRRPEGFKVLSGDDNLALATMALGGDGLISVASNEIPTEMTSIIQLARAGRLAEARRIHYKCLRLMDLNFVESNPMPVKYALFRLGLIEESYRLPLCPLQIASRQKIDAALGELGIL